MRFLAISYGTEGDTRPMAALCRGLIRAGHDAVQFGERSGADLAARADVPYRVLEGDIRETLGRALAEGSGASRNPRTMAEAMAGLATKHSGAWMRALLEERERCDAIVFAGLATYVALSVAEHLGVPAIGAGLQPMEPTEEFPSAFLPVARLPRWLNRVSHGMVSRLLWRAFRTSLNEARRTVTGQEPVREMWREFPVVYGISRQLVPQPKDWPARARITGDWPLTDDAWAPPLVLERFLEAGEAPVYAGFGSMVGIDRAGLVWTLLEALPERRVVLAAGWQGQDGVELPERVLAIGPAPHDWLFPRVAAAIHHGGSGTSHAAARAGTPSVVIPFAGDQFFWAGRLRRAGIAPAALRHGRLTAGEMRRRVEEALGMKERVRAVALEMGREDGVGTAVGLIEEAARGRGW